MTPLSVFKTLTYLRVFRGGGSRVGRGGEHFCAVRSSVVLTARQLSCRGRRSQSNYCSRPGRARCSGTGRIWM
eukprot:scaffold74206_cov71-Phaeocystis_antarctica.AAC.1